jgi:hypothetical protein
MIYYQASSPMGDVSAGQLLDYIQRHIAERRQQGYNGDQLLDDVTRLIAEGRASHSVASGTPPNVWEAIMQIPENQQVFPFPSAPPPPALPYRDQHGAADSEEKNVHRTPDPSVRWASLSPCLHQLRNGDLDDPSRAWADSIVSAFEAKREEAARFARALIERGLSPESLSSYDASILIDFQCFLPPGANSWSHQGVYGCAVCYIPAQPGPAQYAQHTVGRSHASRISRFIEHFKAQPIAADRVCKSCLKVIRPEVSVEAHRRSKKHKAAEASWGLVREHMA